MHATHLMGTSGTWWLALIVAIAIAVTFADTIAVAAVFLVLALLIWCFWASIGPMVLGLMAFLGVLIACWGLAKGITWMAKRFTEPPERP